MREALLAGFAIIDYDFIRISYRNSTEELDGTVVFETFHSGKPVKHPYRAVLFFSPAAADSFFQTNILLEGIPCFCAGSNTSEAVRGHTDNLVIEAVEQTEESMLSSVKEFFRKKYKRYDTSGKEDISNT